MSISKYLKIDKCFFLDFTWIFKLVKKSKLFESTILNVLIYKIYINIKGIVIPVLGKMGKVEWSFGQHTEPVNII